jgi:hypothetical protein
VLSGGWNFCPESASQKPKSTNPDQAEHYTAGRSTGNDAGADGRAKGSGPAGDREWSKRYNGGH